MKVKIFFDTSAIFTQSEHYLLKHDVFTFIQQSKDFADISVSFFLPEMVKFERLYQIERQALDLLPSIQKLERLLGHNLNITSKIISTRVRDSIDEQIRDLGLIIVQINQDKLIIQDLIKSAAFRIPPFSTGDKEKGFRDAIILETFLGFVEDSEKTPQACRHIFLAGDKLLYDSLLQKTSKFTNVEVFRTLDETKNLLNLIASNVSGDFLKKHIVPSNSFFFKEGDDDCYLRKAKIVEDIFQKFKMEIEKLPEGIDASEHEMSYISPTVFISKKRQRVTWMSKVEMERKYFRLVPEETPTDPQNAVNRPLYSKLLLPTIGERKHASPLPPPSEEAKGWASSLIGNLLIPNVKKVFVKKGRVLFEVYWSVLITKTGTLKNPKVEKVEFIGYQFENEQPETP